MSDKSENKTTEEVSDKEARELSVSTQNKRRKKAERREAKAARKAANKSKDKKTRPSNLVIFILIFGVLIAMFAFVSGYNYFSKPESIEKYIENNGGAELYQNLMFDEYTKASIKADGNTVRMILTLTEDAPEDLVESYKGDEGKKQADELGAYFLTSMKPEVRGFSAEVRISVRHDDKRLIYSKLSYKEAKKIIKDAEKEQDASDEDSEGSSESK